MIKKREDDYNDFLNTTLVEPPSDLSNKVLGLIREKLDPRLLTLFSKLGLIQAIVGTLTLLICPQFGISFNDNDSLFLFFQNNFGHMGCMIACGVIFTSFSAIVSLIVLKRPEIKKIFKFQFFVFPIISMLFLTIFACVVQEFYLSVSLLWFTGALTGYLLTFDLGCWVSNHFKNSLREM
jgi:hypothetical protein